MKTDSQLQKDVMDELKWEPAVEAAGIGVEVKDGVVTLAGHVRSYAEKWAAEEAAQRVSGVKGIVVEMDVRVPDASKRTDAEIVQAASDALKWNSSVPEDSVKLAVSGGIVTLSGEVHWDFQRAAAHAAVKNLIGVHGVNNRITLKPVPIDTRHLRRDIQAALHRQAQRDANAITIDVDGATVKLGGMVESWAERVAARNAAWAAPGVQNVVDNLFVSD